MAAAVEAGTFDDDLNKLTLDYDANREPTQFFEVDLIETRVVNWRKMIVQAEREKAEAQRKEGPEGEEDETGRQKYMSFLDELEAKYGNSKNVKDDWYDTEDAFIDDGDLKDTEAKTETKIGGFFVCRGAPEVVPPSEQPPESPSRPKPKKTGDDSSTLLELPLEVRARLKTLKSLGDGFMPGQLERFIQSEVPVTNAKYRKLVTTMFKILNEPSMNVQKRRTVVSQFQNILPFTGSAKWVNNYFKELAMEYDTEEAGSDAYEARQEYLLTLLKRERMTLTRRVKRTIKSDVKEFQSKKSSEKYKCTTFENIIEDLVNAVNVINAEARVSRDSKKMKSITNKDAKQNFFEKMVENWPSGFMTLDKFTELYSKYRKPIPNPWLKRRRGASGPNSPKNKNSPNKAPKPPSNKRVINLVAGASEPQPLKKARVEPGGSVSIEGKRPVIARSFCPKWEPNPWDERHFHEHASSVHEHASSVHS